MTGPPTDATNRELREAHEAILEARRQARALLRHRLGEAGEEGLREAVLGLMDNAEPTVEETLLEELVR